MLPWGFLPGLLLRPGATDPGSVAPDCLPLLQVAPRLLTWSALNSLILAGRLLSTCRALFWLNPTRSMLQVSAGPSRAYACTCCHAACPLSLLKTVCLGLCEALKQPATDRQGPASEASGAG